MEGQLRFRGGSKWRWRKKAPAGHSSSPHLSSVRASPSCSSSPTRSSSSPSSQPPPPPRPAAAHLTRSPDAASDPSAWGTGSASSGTPRTAASATSSRSSRTPSSWPPSSTAPSSCPPSSTTTPSPSAAAPNSGSPTLPACAPPSGITSPTSSGSRRYVSMGDIVHLSSTLSVVRLIDFRVFISTWCGFDLDLACSASESLFLSKNLEQCRALLSGLEGNVQHCVYAVEDDCRTTVWTYGQADDGVLDPFQPDEELRRKKKISFVRRRRDVYKALGPGSEADKATVLAFGSLFSSPYKGSELYIDIHPALAGSRIHPLSQTIEYLPFAQEILSAGRHFAVREIKEPFLCAQLRLLDGQFKNHWKTTFSTLREKIQLLQAELEGNKAQGPIHIFIMTDLPLANWTGSYLEELVTNSKSYVLHSLHEGDELVVQASRMLMAAEHGLRTGILPVDDNIVAKNRTCVPLVLPDILLYVEETICSCASLGFVGTPGSTIAASIELMRRNHACNSSLM